MSAAVYLQQGLHLDRGQIRSYLGCRGMELSAELEALTAEAAAVVGQKSYRVCWRRLPLALDGSSLRFGDLLTVQSTALAKHLQGCADAVLFCATLGSSVDRAIMAQRLHPAQALVWDAVGTAAIEQLCDDFCATLPQPQRPRFSPGYGDLPLDTQKTLLSLLDAQRLLGVSLTDALLMTPTKSVTAIVGLS